MRSERCLLSRTFLGTFYLVFVGRWGQEDGRDQGNVGQVGAAEVGDR